MRSCISIHGAWMYPPDANARMVDIVRTGLLDLAQWDVTTFPLDRANEAVAHAASSARPFSMIVLTV
jgi:threonine dehydrogenase-like Zn-dependent dehydrogenase